MVRKEFVQCFFLFSIAIQILPSMAFVYVGYAAMAEPTGSWIKPQFNLIGWWIGFFNMVGGIGFLLYPILYLPEEFSPEKNHNGLLKWGASMATFWGSCCFWIAGILQCIEFCSENPLQVEQKGLDESELDEPSD